MDQLEKKKADLDKQLESASPNVGIAFGADLFNEFRKRGWFTLEVFGALGTAFFAEQVPAYKKTHFVFRPGASKTLSSKCARVSKRRLEAPR